MHPEALFFSPACAVLSTATTPGPASICNHCSLDSVIAPASGSTTPAHADFPVTELRPRRLNGERPDCVPLFDGDLLPI